MNETKIFSSPAMAGTIEIHKNDITKLKTDAVVNAANSGLRAGGGVCGAIFSAAGVDQLQAACNKIGHCSTGGAVITPSFGMKNNKYIIHAVGPVYNGGNRGEEKDLYSCYHESLKLAKQYGCHSIGFPLISAGIYGYPMKEAWEIALTACNDFLKSNSNYNLNIVFVNRDEDVISAGKKILSKLTSAHDGYKNDNIISKSSESSVNEIIGFHLTTESHGCFSNWFYSDFTYAGTQYSCAEQFMMAQKVALGGRYDLRQKIMETEDPSIIKALGGKGSFPEYTQIKPLWEKHRKHLVKRGVKAKFQQNPRMLRELLDTGDALLCECAGQDKIWGVGINLQEPGWKDVSQWNGSNYLGIILMEVREELRKEQKVKGSVQYIDFKDHAPIPEWAMTVNQLKRIPQYYSAIHAYSDQLPAGHIRDAFYRCTFKEAESMMRDNMGGGLPVAGFYEMKQEIYEIAHKLRCKTFVSDIFREHPQKWGLRGDPYFWETLQSEFAFEDITITEEELSDRIHQIFKQKTQKELTPDTVCYVAEYAHGGMSSGHLSGEWILNSCIPMLQLRLRKLQQETL